MAGSLHDRLADLRYAIRLMRKSPGFTAIAVLSLGLGIGANTAIFTLVDAVLLRMLPVKNPQELYLVATNSARPNFTWNYPDYVAYRDHGTGFSGLIAYSGAGPYGFSVQDSGEVQTQPAFGAFVSGNYFTTLGVEPVRGRLLNAEDDRRFGAGPYAVLSHAFWRRRFSGDPRVVGKNVRINGYPFTIVGVSREGFTGVEIGVSPDFFMPIAMRTEVTKNANWNNRNHWWITVLGRLKPGASIPQIEGELSAIGKNQEEENRRTALDKRFVNTAQPIKLIPGAQGHSRLRTRLSQPLIVLMSLVGVVLLIACANVANLLLARAAARRQEIAVRLALGSGRGRLVWQLLTESALLALMGGAAGLLFAYFGTGWLVDLIPQGGWTRVSLETTPDLRILGFTLAVAMLTGLLFGLAPALQSTNLSLAPELRQETGSTGSRGGFRLRKSLVVLQVALSLLLLIGAGLFVRSLVNLRTLDMGFRKESVLFVSVDPGGVGYKGQRLRDFYERLRERAEALPGVQVATLASITPLGGSRWNQDITVPGWQPKPGDRSIVDQNAVSPRFFELMGIPMVLGRDFTQEDNPAFSPTPPEIRRPGEPPTPEERAGPKVAIVNESMAQKYFSGQNPTGQRFSFGDKYKPEESFEIVGVVKDARYFGIRDATQPMIYQAIWRPGASSRTLCIRTAGSPERMIEAVRRELAALDPAVSMLNARSIEENIDNTVLQEKMVATLSSFFGSLALLLAAVGLYGVMAHSVTRRTREIGIRMALGAERSNVLWLVMREALILVVIGTAIGVPTAIALTRFASAFLYGISAQDPLSLVAGTAVLAGVAFIASFLPAHRASRVDPNVALRYE